MSEESTQLCANCVLETNKTENMSEESTQLCANCKRDIPSVNFTIHEIHCRRNISLCQYCKEPFPRSEMEEHVESEHAQVACKCGVKMEKRHVEKHKLSECGLRLKKCQFCDLELAFNKWGDHEEYCGARTEPCPQCLHNVMLKELSTHPAVCGTQPAEERNNNRGHMGSEEPLPGVWFEAHAIRNLLQGEAVRNSSRPPGLRIPRTLESRVHNSTRAAGAALRGQEKRNTPTRNRDQNQVAEEESFQRNCGGQTGVEGGGDEDSNLDYLLALSLQDENCDYTRGQGTWADQWGDRLTQIATPLLFPDHLTRQMQPTVPASTVSRNNPIERSTDDTMLPCEFCEKLFPEEDLILHQVWVFYIAEHTVFCMGYCLEQESEDEVHVQGCAQTGCNPTSAFASFSKRPPSPLQEDSLFTDSLSPFYSPQHLASKFASLSYGPPPGPAEGTVVIPCEFCGVLLEDDLVFHHQDKCDHRPGTACPTERPSAREPLPPKVENRRKSSPEIQRRQVRHRVQEQKREGTSEARSQLSARTEERRNFRGSVITKPHIPKVRDVEKEEE
ncbi:UNVERIFIED_CONTAM: hypothetical protein FKN15_048018 [Acipenser sinensis]